MGKSIKEKIDDIKETVNVVQKEAVNIGKEQGVGVKAEYKDIEKIRHNKGLIYYKTDALAIVSRKLGGFDEFLKVVDDLTREGYWMMNSEDVKNILSNFGLSMPGQNRGTLYYFQNRKYIN
jgi:urease gamma subunit